MDEIILQENNEVSNESESHKNIDLEIIENDLYQIDYMGLCEKIENI